MALLGTRRARRLVERNILVYRRSWVFFVSGFFEPFFYLLSIGVGLSKLVHPIHVGHAVIPYTVYVAPGLLASSAMNGATLDSTFNVFFKLKIAKTYDAVLSTPLGPGDVALGELTWSLMRATVYSAAFLVVMAGLGYVALAVGRPVPARGDDRQLRLRRGRDGGHDLHAQLAGLRQGLARPHPAVSRSRPPSTRCRCTPAGSRPWSAAPRSTRGWPCCGASTSGSCRGRWPATPPTSWWRGASAWPWPPGAWPRCCCPDAPL